MEKKSHRHLTTRWIFLQVNLFNIFSIFSFSYSNSRSMLQRHISSVVHNYNVQFGENTNYSVLHHGAMSPDSWNHRPLPGVKEKSILIYSFEWLCWTSVLFCRTLAALSQGGVTSSPPDILGFEAIEWFFYFFIFLREIPFHIKKDSTKSLSSCLHATSGEVVVIPGIKDIK